MAFDSFSARLVGLLALLLVRAAGQDYVWRALAGSIDGPGFADGSGAAVRFHNPGGMARDAAGNVYVADSGNHVIRRMTPDGTVSTFAGKPGHPGGIDGTGEEARFNFPADVAVDATGNVLVADTENHAIRLISPLGAVTTLAGVPGSPGISEGPGSISTFYSPSGLAVHPDGTVIVADTYNQCIRRVYPDGRVQLIAGDPFYRDPAFPNPEFAPRGGYADGQGMDALFRYPTDVEVDAAGIIHVLDSGNHVLRRIDAAHNVTTLHIPGVPDSYLDAQKLLLEPGGSMVLVNGSRLLRVRPDGLVTLLAGDATGYADGVLNGARFSAPAGLAIDSAGDLLVADSGNHALRRISTAAVVTTIAGGGPLSFGSADGTGAAASFREPGPVAVDAQGNVYVADIWNHTIRRVTPAGEVSTLAGLAGYYAHTDGTGSEARFRSLGGIAVGQGGLLYVTDGSTIRRVTPGGAVTTIAGSAAASGYQDGPSGDARFSAPQGIAIGSDGTMYVADTGNRIIRKITPDGAVSKLAGTGSAFGPGSFYEPTGVAVDAAGVVYVTDRGNHAIRRIAPDGTVSTLAAGSPQYGVNQDGDLAQAGFYNPKSIAVDPAGNLFVTSTYHATVRKITQAGVVTTIGGARGFGKADGLGARAQFSFPHSVAVGHDGKLYFAESYGHRVVVGEPVSGPDIAIQFTPGADLPDGGTAAFADTGAGQFRTGVFRIVNRGDRNLTGLSLSIDGAGAGEFFSDQKRLADSVPPGGASEFSIVFAPRSLGSKTAVARVRSNDADEAAFPIRLTGNGLPVVPDIQIAGMNYDTTSASLGFGDLYEGDTLERSYSIANRGLADLTGLTVTLVSASTPDFTLAVPPVVTTLAPGESTSFLMRLVATTTGNRVANLRIASNDPNENPVELQIRAYVSPRYSRIEVRDAAGGKLTDGQGTVPFTTAPAAARRTFTILNTGNGPLTGLSVSVDGTGAGDFSVSGPPSPTIPPGGSADFVVSFAPSGAGLRRAALHIVSSASPGNSFDITLAGRAAPGLPFPGQGFYIRDENWTSSAVQVSGFTGNVASLRLVLMGFSHGAPDELDLWLMSPAGTVCKFMSDAGDDYAVAGVDLVIADDAPAPPPEFDRIISGTFRPVDYGDPAHDDVFSEEGTTVSFPSLLPLTSEGMNGVWTLWVSDDNDEDDDGGSIAAWWLEAEPGPPAPEIVVEEPAGVSVPYVGRRDFGLLPAGGEVRRTFVIRNTGEIPLEGIAVSVVSAGGFTLVASPVAALAPGAATECTVRFAPATGGIFTGTLFIASNDALESPFPIALTGEGIVPVLTVQQPAGTSLSQGGSRSFGSIGADSSVRLTFTLQNSGKDALTGISATLAGPHAGDFRISGLPVTSLAPSGSTTLAVDFTPAAVGTRSAVLLIASNAPDNNPWSVTLSGTGLPPLPEITVEQPVGTALTDGGSASFGSVPVGGSASRTITVRNTGTAPLTLTGVTRDGFRASDYTVTAPPGGTVIAPGAIAGITVEFRPGGPAGRSAALHILSNDADENPFDIVLTGIGLAALPDISVELPGGGALSDGGTVPGFSVPRGQPQAVQTLVIRNTGYGNLTGLSFSFDGASATEFTGEPLLTTVLAPGNSTALTLHFNPGGFGLRTAALHIASNDSNENPFDLALSGQRTVTRVFRSTAAIAIPPVGLAAPWPATIAVPALPPGAFAVRVWLRGLIHPAPDDLDIWLYAPGGSVLPLCSDAGGTIPVIAADILLTDGAPSPLPDAGPLVSGAFSPASWDPGEPLPILSPATAVASLAGLLAGPLEGDWGLFVLDDAMSDHGSLSAWELEFDTPDTPGYHEWAAAAGLDATRRAPELDADGDGLPNLVEFALGGNPLTAATVEQPALQPGGDGAVLIFLRPDDAESSVALTVEWSTDLLHWTGTSVGATSDGAVSIVENDSGPDRVEVAVPGGARPATYVRLRASLR